MNAAAGKQRIEPAGRWTALDVAELWQYRELALLLAWRDIKVRYKQTEFGILWAILQPLLTTGVFALIFGLFSGPGREPGAPGLPYVLSTFAAMVVWHFLASSVDQSSQSLIQAQNVINKVYFPRMVLPVAATLTALVDMAVGMATLGLLMVWYGVAPTASLAALPLAVLLVAATALAAGIWMAALSALYRDFRYALPFIMQAGLFLSPVFYSAARLEGRIDPWLLWLYRLNPAVGAVEGFRWSVFGGRLPLEELALGGLVTALLLLGGMFFFRRTEQEIADVI